MKKILIAAIAALAIFGCNKQEKIETKADSITVTPKEKEVTEKGGSFSVQVTSTGDWTLKGKADYSSWVTPSAMKGVDGDIITFNVKANAETQNKVAEWVFTCGKATDILKLTSKGIVIIPDHLKLVSDANIVVNEKAGEIVVKLETSLGYRTLKNTLSEGADWLKFITTLEVDGLAEMHFSYPALEGLKDRSAEITVTGKGVEPVKVNVLQEAKRVLDIAQPFYTAPVEGGNMEVGISTNVAYEITISEEGKSWITLGEKKDGSVIFSIKKLDGDKRSAKISFKQTDAKEGKTPLTAEITVSQLSALVHWAANMKGNRLFPKWEGDGGPGRSEQFTLETLVKFDNFDKPSGGIFTIMGIEGRFLLRMGDVGNSLNNLQIATRYANFNVTDFDFQANQWYHIAVVYGDSTLEVYVDGDLKQTEGISLGYVDLSPQWSYEGWGDRCFWVGYSYEYNRDTYGQMTEVRIWKKALTAEEIKAKDHFYKVDPKSEGLYSYWPFTAGKGNYIEDATGKGNKLYGERNVRKVNRENKGEAGIEWVKVSLPEK